jgi:ABC-type transporter Mla subunit MlaD
VEPLSVLPAEEGGGLAELLKSGRLESILSKVDGIIFHVQELSEKLVASSDQLKATLTNLAVITDRLREGKGSAGRLLSEKEDIYQELLRSIQNTRESLENLKATSAEIRRASPEARRLLEQGETSLIEAQKVIRAVQKTWPLNRKIPVNQNQTRIQLDAREEIYPQTVTGP